MKKSRGIPISSLPPHLQAQVRAQDRAPMTSPKPDQMIRQSAAKLNKTEARFLEWLNDPARDFGRILTQAWTLKIGNGVRYTPDFVTLGQVTTEYDEDNTMHLLQIKAWEVKGFLRDDAAVKLKVAAREYPEIKFTLVWWDKKSFNWKFQDLRP